MHPVLTRGSKYFSVTQTHFCVCQGPSRKCSSRQFSHRDFNGGSYAVVGQDLEANKGCETPRGSRRLVLPLDLKGPGKR